MKLTSPAFKNEERIPEKYTCQGKDINPPLNFADIPKKARSLALIVDDPDSPSGNFTHWIIWNIPVDKKGFEEDYLVVDEVEGTNDFGDVGYGGPCPGSGTHRYFFRLFALDTKLKLKATTTKEDLEEKIEDHVLDEIELIGLYSK